MSDNKPPESNNDKIYWTYILYAIAACTLLLAGFGFAIKSWQVVAIELLIGFAALSVGFLIGFLFGLPRAGMQNATGELSSESGATKSKGDIADRVTYRPSTNLEQISDWLTKILIGVGLVELGQIKVLLAELGRVVGKLTPGFPGNEVLPQIVLVAYSMLGFFIGYIWTRIEYTKLQVGVDRSILAELQSLSQRTEQNEKVTELIAKGDLVSPSTDNIQNTVSASNTGSSDIPVADAVEVNDNETPASENSIVGNSVNIDVDRGVNQDNNANPSSPPIVSKWIYSSDIDNASPRIRVSDLVGWPDSSVNKLGQFLRAKTGSGDAVNKVFGVMPSVGVGRQLVVKIENVIVDTIVFSASASNIYGGEDEDVWFLLNPIFGSSRVKKVKMIDGEAKMNFSTTELFTIAAIMNNGRTILTYNLRKVPNLPARFLDK